MSRTKTTDALPIPLISCPCPSAFSPRGFFCACHPHHSAPRRRAALSRQTVFPLGQFDVVRGAVRIPFGRRFLCLRQPLQRFCRQAERAGCRGRRLSGSLRVCVSRGRVFPRFGGQGAKMGRLRRSGVLAPVLEAAAACFGGFLCPFPTVSAILRGGHLPQLPQKAFNRRAVCLMGSKPSSRSSWCPACENEALRALAGLGACSGHVTPLC